MSNTELRHVTWDLRKVLASSFYREGNGGTGRLNNVPTVTLIVKGRTRFGPNPSGSRDLVNSLHDAPLQESRDVSKRP